MAVTFFPFNSIVVDGVPDRPANAENLAAYLAGFFSNGVIMQEDAALKVEAYSGMEVQINAGMGNIKGKTILNDAAEIVTLAAANASLNRIDRVVFRLDEAERLMEFDVLTGTPASDPVAPELTQTADVHELCLAEIRVPAGATSITASYITDTRTSAQLPNHTHDITDVGAISIVRLWENASPTSEFAGQSIEIDNITDYRLFVVVCRFSTDNAKRIVQLGQLDSAATSGNQNEIQWLSNLESTVNILHFYRRWTIYVAGSITFADCGYRQGNTTNTSANTYIIPVEIYGIKGVQ